MSEVQVIVPPEIKPVSGLVTFLAGPIQGAADWQKQAIDLFADKNFLDESLTVASPRRSDETWKFQYELQVDWESHYLARAAANGVIMFWCSKEFEHVCDRAYAQTTRMELGEWLAISKIYKTPLVVGIEEGYTGARYIRHRMSKPGYEHIAITSTLEETVEASLHVLTYVERRSI